MEPQIFYIITYTAETTAGETIRIDVEVMRVEQAAQQFSYAPRTIRQWCDEGRVKAHKYLGKWWIEVPSIEKYAAERRD